MVLGLVIWAGWTRPTLHTWLPWPPGELLPRTAGRVGTQPQGCQGRSCTVVWGPVWDEVEKTCGLQDCSEIAITHPFPLLLKSVPHLWQCHAGPPFHTDPEPRGAAVRGHGATTLSVSAAWQSRSHVIWLTCCFFYLTFSPQLALQGI